ncbi:MAG: hypothetical protein KDA28_05330, partial [Phycisphaerales bacterium]|nr:hypothetical protein [Phycisphaerales bacterium]
GTEIRFDERTWTIEGRRWDEASPKGTFEVLSDQVERLRFRYFDGERWSDRFDSLSRSSLPVAVEVAIWFAPPGTTPPALDEADDLTRFGALPEDDTNPGDLPDFAREDDESADMPDMIERMQGDVLRQPDRVRLITVPDGPVTAWRESRSPDPASPFSGSCSSS